MTGRLLVVSGPSGVGKGTVIAAALRLAPGLELATSATTRPRRRDEVDGREYHFLSEAEFLRRVGQGEFLEHVSYAGNRYGTLILATRNDFGGPLELLPKNLIPGVKMTSSRSTEYTTSDWPDGMKVLLVELLLALEVSGGKGVYQ